MVRFWNHIWITEKLVSIEFPDISPALLASYMVMAHWSKLKMLILVYCHGGCYVLHPVGTCSSPDHLLFHVAESKSVYYTAFGQHVSLVSCSVWHFPFFPCISCLWQFPRELVRCFPGCASILVLMFVLLLDWDYGIWRRKWLKVYLLPCIVDPEWHPPDLTPLISPWKCHLPMFSIQWVLLLSLYHLFFGNEPINPNHTRWFVPAFSPSLNEISFSESNQFSFC